MKLLTQKIPLLIALVALLFVAASCGKSGGSRKPSNVDYYTCTMHPSVKSQTPGKCPICSMDLVPVMKRGGEEAKAQASPQAQDTKDARETQDKLIEAAKRRLHLWNVTDAQIDELQRTRKPQENLTLLSPFRGIVQSVPVDQGKGVKVGDMLVEVADLSVVWVWAEFYENELSMLQVGQKIAVTAKSYPGQNFEGTLSLINPFLDEMKRTAKVRIDIPNPEFKLRPGMYVNAELAMDMGEALTVPVSAIMPTGDRNIVFVDKGEGKLEPRIVRLGSKYGDIYEVQSGLQQGERVVASANFLIDAESKVQGALKEFEQEKPAEATGSPVKP